MNTALLSNDVRRRRAQAFDVYPFLEPLWHIDGRHRHKSHNSLISMLSGGTRRKIRRAIDRGEPLSGLITKALNLDPWMIKHLRTYWLEHLGYDQFKHDGRGWDLRRWLAVWTPQCAPREYQEFKRISWFTGLDRDGTKPLSGRVHRQMRGRDRRLLLKIAQHADGFEKLGRYLDFLHVVNSWISGRRGNGSTDRRGTALGATSVSDWWVLCLRWHRINKRLNAWQMQARYAEGEWPAFFPGSIHAGPFSFTCLTSQIALWRQGKRMQNCVAAYAHACAQGSTHIVHVAYGMAPAATLELQVVSVSPRVLVRIGQMQSAPDTRLTSGCQAAIERLVEQINQGSIEIQMNTARGVLQQDFMNVVITDVGCVDYPTFTGRCGVAYYFDMHVRLTGTLVFEAYRTALELSDTVTDSMYRLAVDSIEDTQASYRTSIPTGRASAA